MLACTGFLYVGRWPKTTPGAGGEAGGAYFTLYFSSVFTHALIYQEKYGVGPGDSIGLSVRYQGELWGLRDPQNRDLRRKSPPETEK